MLIGFDRNETWGRIWYRFKRVVEREIESYPMIFHQRNQKPRADLKCSDAGPIAVTTDAFPGPTTAAEPRAMKASPLGTAFTRLCKRRIPEQGLLPDFCLPDFCQTFEGYLPLRAV
jgi:hypothetical protein